MFGKLTEMMHSLVPSLKEQTPENTADADQKKSKTLAEITAMLQIANKEREKYDAQLDKNRKIYMGAHKEVFGYAAPGFYATVNLTKGAIEAKASVLNEVAIRPAIKPRDSSAPPDFYLAPGQQIDPSVELTDGQVAGTEAIPSDLAAILQQQGVQMIAVDDDMACEAITQELQNQWIADCMDEKNARANRDKMIYGWRDQIVEWDPSLMRGVVKTLYPYAVWLDPMSSGSSDADFAIVVNWVSKGEATKRYPKLAKEIDNFTANTLFGQVNAAVGSRFSELIRSNKIPLMTVWVRHSQFPVDEANAIEQGLVQKVDGDGADIQPHFVTKDGTPVQPGQEGWPVTTGLREIELCGAEVVSDGPSDFRDLPLSRNMNFPIPDCPFAMGDPEVVGDTQDLINREFGVFHDYTRNYRMPMMVATQSLFEKMPGYLKNGFKNANMIIPMDDTVFMEMGGKPIQQLDVPSMPDTAFNILNKLLEQFDRLSGHNDAMRGDAKAGFSGTLYKQMTANARGPIAEQARETSEHIERLTRVWVALILDFLPPEEFARRNKKYPPAVMYCIKNRLENMIYDLDVQVSGADNAKQEGQDLANMAQTAPDLWSAKTFVKTILEKWRVPKADIIAEEIAASKAAAAAPPMPPPM